MPVDWSATGDMLSGIGTISGSIAVLIAAAVGRNAFADYRKQRLLERQIEHADSALTSAYKLGLALSAIRNPMSTGGDLREAEQGLDDPEGLAGMTDDRRQRLIQANVYYVRSKRFASDFEAAVASLPFVKAYLGEKAFDALSEIIRCRNSVLVYAGAYADDRGGDLNFSRKIQSYIWEGVGDVDNPDEGDPVAKIVEKSTKALEEIALPILRFEEAKKRADTNG